MFVFIVVINAYNLIDGIDGLALSFSVFAIYLLSNCFSGIDSEISNYGLFLIAILIPFFFFNSSYSSPVLNFNDKDFVFNYTEFENLIYNPSVFESNLVSVISFYGYTLQ